MQIDAQSTATRERREEENTQANVTNPLKDLFPSCPFYYHFIVWDGFILSAFVALNGLPCTPVENEGIDVASSSSSCPQQYNIINGNDYSAVRVALWLHSPPFCPPGMVFSCSTLLAIVCLAMDMHII